MYREREVKFLVSVYVWGERGKLRVYGLIGL